MRQADGHQITLLFLDSQVQEEDEEEGEMDARWSPQFRR